MWDNSTGWKWHTFAEYLPTSVLNLFEAHEVASDDSLNDQFFWNSSGNGTCSIKSIFSTIRRTDPALDHPNWKTLWSNPAPNRMKFFLWLAMHNRVLCNSNRVHRHPTTDASCPLCSHPCESVMHTLRDCPNVSHVWNAICPINRSQQFFAEMDIPSWICHNLTLQLPLENNDWILLFSITTWWIWKWCNCVVFQRDNEIPDDKVFFLKNKLQETKHALEHNNIDALTSMTKRETLIQWSPPAYQWFALNTDGAAKGCPGPAGGGGIVRSHHGQVLGYFHAKFGVCTAIRAELLALLKGLQMAWDLGLKFIDVRMDSKPCTQILSNYRAYGGANLQIIEQCFEMMFRPQWTVHISHCFREANKPADWLANQGIHQSTSVTFPSSLPPELAKLVKDDIIGVAWPRMIAM